MARPVILAALLALVGCSEQACLEKDTAAAEKAFSACVASGSAWGGKAPGPCSEAAEAVACKRRVEAR